MPFVDDTSVYLNDFGVTVIANALFGNLPLFSLVTNVATGQFSGTGILDQPGIIEENGVAVVSTDYRLTCEATKFGAIVYNDTLTVAGIAYRVRDTRLIDDGSFCQIALSKT